MQGGRKRLTSKDLEVLIPIAAVGLKGPKSNMSASERRLRGATPNTDKKRTQTPDATPTPRQKEEAEEKEHLSNLSSQFKSTLSAIYSNKGMSGPLSRSLHSTAKERTITTATPKLKRPRTAANRRPQSAAVSRPSNQQQPDSAPSATVPPHLVNLNFNAMAGTVKKLDYVDRQSPRSAATASKENSPSRAAETQADGDATATAEAVATPSVTKIPAPPSRPQSAPINRLPVGKGIVSFPPQKGSTKAGASHRPETAKERPGEPSPAGQEAASQQAIQGPTSMLETTSGRAPVIKAVEISYGTTSYAAGSMSSKRRASETLSTAAGTKTSTVVAATDSDDDDDGHWDAEAGPRTAAQIASETGFFGHYEHATIRDYLQSRLRKRYGAYGAGVASNLENLKAELANRNQLVTGTAGGAGGAAATGSASPRLPTPKEFLYSLQHPTQPLSARSKKRKHIDEAMSRLEQPPASRPARPHSASVARRRK